MNILHPLLHRKGRFLNLAVTEANILLTRSRRLFLRHTIYRVRVVTMQHGGRTIVQNIRSELGGAVRNEFPLLIIETIKMPASRTMAVRGRVGVRATGATVVVLIFADWRVANVVDDIGDGALGGG